MNIVAAMHKCNQGDHDLIEILRSTGYETDEVARWCRICGAVVVDYEYDGRLAGHSIKMMGPLVSKDKQIYYTSQKDD
jgi:hypothetical protein